MSTRSRDDDPKRSSKPPKDPTPEAPDPASVGATESVLPTGGITVRPVGGTTLSGRLPAGSLTAALAGEADVSDDLAGAAPSFGAVLASVGDAIVTSQQSLDAGIVDTVKSLNDSRITIVTDVIQELDDDGLPVASKTQLITQEVSTLNFVTPTVHEWKHVAVSMDLEVGDLDTETGVRFSRDQHTQGTHAYGLFWGFLGWFDTDDKTTYTSTSRSTDRETSWAQGQVRLDARLAPRETTKFPTPAEVSVGPQLYFAQGGATETDDDGTIKRTLEMTITVRKADGSPNPSKVVSVDGGTLQVNYATADGFTGSTTNTAGQVRVNLVRTIPSVVFSTPSRRSVSASLGQISSSTTVVI